jgi:hypothetical protein
MFSGISKKQIRLSNRLNEDGIDMNNEPRNGRHRNRYPLAPVGRPPDILYDRPRPEGDRGNDHFIMKDNR